MALAIFIILVIILWNYLVAEFPENALFITLMLGYSIFLAVTNHIK